MKEGYTFFSVIIPVYNRPHELDELLNCLVQQQYKHFEVVIIEDGSQISSKEMVDKYTQNLSIQYFYKENGGQGFARNYAFERAKGDFFVILDSDALVEANYLEEVDKGIQEKGIDLFGGPDKDHPSFTPIQKAISFSMTSLFTTGGIRGKEKNVGGQFHPRSFNMGISRKVWEATQGFKITRMGEDIEFSIRCLSLGFKSALLPKAYIYHKRRTDFSQFYKQLHFFGRARINISRFFPQELKWVHFFPACYLIGMLFVGISLLLLPTIGKYMAGFVLLYWIGILVDAFIQTKSLHIAILGLIAANIQLIAYGQGFLEEAWKKITNKPS
ncbi:glycosyltransferase [Cytophagaceae bacterium 50C-KIRBA]|uniref:Glycosyltransferase n=1 Tax=Aquirufa beregesia TaxID=2516556 RepID=A0ABX0EU31_9BACT|nr:glycosyltransferase [Aquirufa beregesia]NGZ43092.1 glycosyltransferase [Aquirufa beregesia]